MMEKRASSPSPMDIMGGSRDEEDGSSSSNVTTMRTAETLLRLVPMTLCIAALVVFGACEWNLCRLFPSFSHHCSHASPMHNVFTYVILAAGAVSLELVYLAYKGDTGITWSAACVSYGAFCHKATASIALTFVVVACYAVISLISSYKLFSRYDAPVANSSNIAAF
ncbi:casp-like protein 2a1 [Quercus suber]|uniref:CASP-like protein n=1 Tax=Quercus suber TaxID=58331 RepID=A0AAW0KYP3_QUESU